MNKCKKLLVLLLTVCMITASFAGMAFAEPETGWQKDGDHWIYIQEDGTRKTGWLDDGGKWYYLDEENGYMIAGKAYQIGLFYYVFNNKGVMQSDGWASVKVTDEETSRTNWYYLHKNGKAYTEQWKKIKGKWYYFGEAGTMYSAACYGIAGKYYLFGNNGAWISTPGWNKLTFTNSLGQKVTNWYYLKNNGTGYNGWLIFGGKWYYISRGYMINGCVYDVNWENYVEGEEYIPDYYAFNKNGTLIDKAGWLKVVENDLDDVPTITHWYYVEANGKPVTGWKKVKGTWYYFDLNGIMVANRSLYINKKVYMFKSSGALESKTGWKKLIDYYADGTEDVSWYYLKSGGVCTVGWDKIGGKWYCFRELDGRMYTGGPHLINGKQYTFDEKGVWIK